jgi:hypothetical protein
MGRPDFNKAIAGSATASPVIAIAEPAVPVTLRGMKAIRHLIAFVRDQVDCMSTIYEDHGPFVAIDAFGSLRQLGVPMIFAVGPDFNRTVLLDSDTWRTARLTMTGPRHSAQRRLGNNLVSLNWHQHAYYRRLISPPFRKTSIDLLGDDIGRIIA